MKAAESLRCACCLAVSLLVGPGAGAQNLSPPLAEWKAVGPGGGVNEPGAGERLFREGPDRIVVRGDGKGSVFWRSPDLALEPGGTYTFRFRARGSGRGLIISGPDCVNHDEAPPGDWRTVSFSFRVPDRDGKHFLRLGQWELDGEVAFEGPELYPARVTHGAGVEPGKKEIPLGAGETWNGSTYIDLHTLGWRGKTIHRTLHAQSCWFNTHRWTFGEGSEVVYRHDLPAEIGSGEVRLNVNYRTGGRLELSASRDGAKWVPLDATSATGEVARPLPAEVFPSRAVYVRLRGAGDAANLQVDAYRFQGTTRTPAPAALDGKTWIADEIVRDPAGRFAWVGADLLAVRAAAPGTPVPEETTQGALALEVLVDGRSSGEPVEVPDVAAKRDRRLHVRIPSLPPGAHSLALRLTSGGRERYVARAELDVGALDERGYGSALPSPLEQLTLWWCDGARKVARACPPPPLPIPGSPAAASDAAVRIEAAGGEYEPAQLVLRPSGPAGLRLQDVAASDLVGEKGRIPASRIAILEVATVRVEHAIDASGGPGDYPDPLPPLVPPLVLRAGENQALWILAHVPRGTPPGDYRGTLTLDTSVGQAKVPLVVHAFGFDLPAATSLRGGFGLDPSLIARYHGLESEEDRRAVYDLYLKSFAEHRITPYTFDAFDPMDVRFEGEGAARRPVVDFAAFDRAATRYLDELGFNSFQLHLRGLGGGTFHERHLGEFGGHRAGTEEYERLLGDYLRQVESHLAGKGWLSRAYVYWFDEPDPKDYPFVTEVMGRLKRHAPGLRRLLTEQPEPDLLGHVEIWCGLTPEWTPEKVEARRKAGEEVWWYICTGPRAPYIGLFIEHPAIELRLWSWQSWQYGVQGLLVWQTNYWTSPTAFPSSLQDPWEDPMSYTTGYGVPSGTKLYWGSGDGRFLYPPRRSPPGEGPPVLEGPISSIRWENLRDGIEDHEYFVLLRDLIRKKAPAAVPLPDAESLLQVPESISKDLTRFTKDPSLLLEHRRRLARAIERLTGL